MYEYVMIMLETMSDREFIKNELPKIDGCISPYNIRIVLAKGYEEINDQLSLHYTIVGLQGLTVLFYLLTLFSWLCRRCLEKRREDREFK